MSILSTRHEDENQTGEKLNIFYSIETRSGLSAPLFSTGSDFSELARQHSTHTESPEGSLASPTEPKAKSDRAGATAADNPTPTVSHSPVRSPLEPWMPTQDWVTSWKTKLPLQTIMRLLQVLVPQVPRCSINMFMFWKYPSFWLTPRWLNL